MLIQAINTLKLDNNLVTIQQLDEIFTHKSYLNTKPKYNLKSNVSLNIIGSYILSMLCCEYVFNSCDYHKNTLMDKCNDILREDNFTQTIPDECLNYLLKAEGTNTYNKKSFSKMKYEIFRSLVGAIWINLLESTYKSEITAKDYVFSFFRYTIKDKTYDYVSLLQTVVHYLHIQYTNDFSVLNKDVTTYHFKSTIKVSINEKSYLSVGYGSTKKYAHNNSAKNLLPKLFSYCKDNTEIMQKYYHIIDPEILVLYKDDTTKKSNSFTNTKPSLLNEPVIKNTTQKSNNSTQNLTSKKRDIYTIPKNVSFINKENTLYICKGTISCKQNKHEIISSTRVLRTLKDNSVLINVNYCINCDIYFISLSEYKYYKDIYGTLLGNFSFENISNVNITGYSGLYEESILKLCGYTVNKSINLSSAQRHKILINILENDMITKFEIIEYLQFFINNSKHRKNMQSACKKWSEDLAWIRSYNINNQKSFVINSIKKY